MATATRAPRPELLLLAALLGVCALGFASAQSPVVTWADKLPGKWYGSCVQLAYSNVDGTEAMCLPSKLKIRYRITFDYTATTYNYTSEAGTTTYAGKTYTYAPYTSGVGNYTQTDNGDDTACTQVTQADGSTVSFLSFVYKLGSFHFYVEEGIYNFDNEAKDVCLWNIGMGQRCVRARKYYTYSCTARKVA